MSAPALRPIDQQRVDHIQDIYGTPATGDDIWYIHSVLAQCFLPYKEPKTRDWIKTNGNYGIILTAGVLKDPNSNAVIQVGLPYGAKPRLFQSYICTQALKQRTKTLLVEPSMSAMMHGIGLQVTGGKEGTINRFKDQINRFAACNFTITGPGKEGREKYIKSPPIESFEVWFPKDPNQTSFWPSEIELTQKYFDHLVEHAIPYDFRVMRVIRNKPRAQDIYLWMTQRLCRIKNKPLFLDWQVLYEMFGGESTLKKFKQNFPSDLLAARSVYPDSRMENHKNGFLFYSSPPPIPKTKLFVQNPLD